MIVLGIDPGFARTGYGLLQETKKRVIVLDCGCITTAKDLPFADRLLAVADDITNLIDLHRPDSCAIEKLFFAKNTKTALSVAEARGAIMLSVRKMSVPVFEYTPLQVKQAVTGYGRADKNQIKCMVQGILGITTKFPIDDVSDALAIAVCHLNSTTRRA